MNTFEQNLEMLVQTLEQESQEFDKKCERLVLDLTVEFERGATCPLSQLHQDFIKILLKYDQIPDIHREWAKGVQSYEIALRTSTNVKVGNDAPAQELSSQPITEKKLAAPQHLAGSNMIEQEAPRPPRKTDVLDWNEDL